MTLPTSNDFNNAKRDIDDLAEIVSSPEIKDVANRRGGGTPTLAKVMKDLIERGRVRNRGAWSSGTEYSANDIWESSDGVWYVVVSYYVSSATFQIDIESGNVFVHQINITNDTVFSFAELRTFQPTLDGQQIKLLGHSIPGLGGGDFFYDASDVSSDDDNGTVAVSLSGARLKRKDVTTVDPVMFGALVDGSDSSDAIISACAAAGPAGIEFSYSHSFSRQIVGVLPWVQKPGSKLMFTGTPFVGATVEIGSDGVVLQEKLSVFDISNSNIHWSTEGFIGLRVINFANCRIEYRNIFGFNVGVQELGFNNGFAYNEIAVGILVSNKIQIEWATKGANSPLGYHNENLYFGGRLTNYSHSPVGVTRIGVRVYSIDGVYENNNNNVWMKPSFELFDGGLPVSMEDGVQNEFLYFRNESNGEVFVRESGNSSENLYLEGYSDRFDVANKLVSVSSHRDSIYVPSRTKIKQFMAAFFDSGSIIDKCNYYSWGRLNTYHVALFEGISGSTTYVDKIPNFELLSDSLKLTSVTKGIGVSVDTRNCKRIGIRPNCNAPGGRVTVVCYDSLGDQIVPVDDINLFTMKGRTFSAETIFFGGYRFGVDIGADDDQWYQFTVGDNVHSIDVIFAAGSGALDIRSFTLWHADVDDDSVPLVELRSCRDDFNIATGVPTQGVHKLGEKILNAAPAVGEPEGWLCIQSGDFSSTPPVYASLGMLS